MWMVFEVLVNIVQAVLILILMKSRLHISRKHKIHDMICVISISLFLSAYLFFSVPISDVFVFVIVFLYALAVADDKWYISTFWVSILALVFMSITSLSLHIFMSIPQTSYDTLMGMNNGRIAFVLTTNLVLSLVVYVMSKVRKDYSTPYWPALLLFLFVNISLFIVEESLYTLHITNELSIGGDTIPFFWAYIGLCLCTIFVILLFHMMSQSVERENRYRAEANAIAQSKRYQQELERMYKNLQKTKHDLKQHFQTLEQMVHIGNNDEAKKYLKAYQKDFAGDEIFLTGSTAVDALLMSKALTMKKSGIIFRYSPYPLDLLPMIEPDFCTIIGNLLDNAIEGTLRVTDPISPLAVQLTFSRSWEMFYIYCSNPCNEQTIRADKGRWLSSKETEGVPGLHAIGIRSMQHMIHAAEGRCTFEVVNGYFNVKIVLPYSIDEDVKPNDSEVGQGIC